MRLALACAIALVATPALADRQRIGAKIDAHVARTIGPQWRETAQRIAHIESRHRPHVLGPRTRQGRAIGVFQVMPGSIAALGYSVPAVRRSEDLQIAVGVAHMQACLRAGVATQRQMIRCHQRGVAGWQELPARQSRLYRRQRDQ
jgi:hypothetical protein